MQKPRVLIADDHPLVAQALEKLVTKDCNVVELAYDGVELVEKTKKFKPELVITDVVMPALNGIEAGREIKRLLPKTKIIYLSQQTGSGYVETAFSAGASGYVAKQAAWEELRSAIHEVMRGQVYVSREIAVEDAAARREKKLTPRQRQVLLLIAEGKSIKEIGAALGISAKTVEFHKAAIMDTLGKRTTAELTRYALQAGFLIESVEKTVP